MVVSCPLTSYPLAGAEYRLSELWRFFFKKNGYKTNEDKIRKILKLDSRVKFVGGYWVMEDAQINGGSIGFRLGDRVLVSLCFFLISDNIFYRRDEATNGEYVCAN